ncbi:hypothetical protein Nepgr_012540 [Nepenthes gracilis]|uniref:Uncharacterized protein n=1 Tax=Nepenthes gracilis TaxID=150966 RepID=A0AAD3SHG4_NEPGR|nr:hypothetical protein Nepgr_012540 [Nepenthes gracilis]
MRSSLSNVGLGLSVVFGCLVLALMAEIYYLLWWKRRWNGREIEEDYSSPAREIFCMFCCKRPCSMPVSSTAPPLNPQQLFKPPFEEDGDCLETELIVTAGPPRFLFTIKEETKEDLESEDGKSLSSTGDHDGSRRLSDLLKKIETPPYLTPMSSPPFFTPPLTPSMGLGSNSPFNLGGGYNPFLESSTDAEFNKIKSSPPPAFKFLQDAEEKLEKKKMMMMRMRTTRGGEREGGDRAPAATSKLSKDEGEESFITIIVAKNNERET